MDPLTTSVATVVTGYLAQGAAAIASQVGEAAARVAETLARAVLDRLRSDPAETRTVERYERDPATQQASIEAAIDDLVAADPAFADHLRGLLQAYGTTAVATVGVQVGGDVGGSIQVGDHNIVIDRTTGNVTIGREPARD